MRSMEKVEVMRELNATEIKQVSGGTITSFDPSLWVLPPPTQPRIKPLQA
jgi:hypothetical protein